MFDTGQTPEPKDIGSVIQNIVNQFSELAKTVLSTVDMTVIDISRAAYVTVLLVGVFLYFTRIERRLGKDLIKGGIVLAVLAEFVFPLISKL
jgi:hypothetical protein